VDLVPVLSHLQGFDGWALSTNETALRDVLALCPAGTRIASWHRGARPGRSSSPRSSWEPVLYRPARQDIRDDWTADSLEYVARPRLTDPERVIGAKPAAFCSWLFALLGARAGDSLDDLFPGSGGIARAWEIFTEGAEP
jgi:hypothetical protein